MIDGTGAPPRENQRLVIANGRIAALGDAASTPVPAGAQSLDLTGKSIIPGLVMMHEHLFYPTGPGVYGNLSESFTRLYLADGVTSMRTGGNTNGYGEINIARQIARGEKPGPWIDGTAPCLQGPGLDIAQMHELKNADGAHRLVSFWADAGATSFKAYMNITRAELHAGVEEAHKRGRKSPDTCAPSCPAKRQTPESMTSNTVSSLPRTSWPERNPTFARGSQPDSPLSPHSTRTLRVSRRSSDIWCRITWP